MNLHFHGPSLGSTPGPHLLAEIRASLLGEVIL